MIFTEDNLALWLYRDAYLFEILNGEYTVESAREDLQSLIDANTKSENTNHET